MPRANYEWSCLAPKPVIFKKLCGEEVQEHPLSNVVKPVAKSEPKGSKPGSGVSSVGSVLLDPLSASLDGDDPLSAMAAERDWYTSEEKEEDYRNTFGCRPWSEEKAKILGKFTTSQKLSVAFSFLTSGDRSATKAQTGVRTRLEQWDDFDEGSKEYGQVTQQELTDRIGQLNKELVEAWNQDFRVNALKITIQCSKLLVDTSVIHFYPSKFVLATDILDIFGKLVYKRLHSKAEYVPPGSGRIAPLPKNFTAEMVPESAKETCRNWFYKIASIRELVPRFYVEAAVLESYSYLTSKGFSQALLRLTKMIRGIGDPLVAVYARLYLCRVAMSVSTIDLQILTSNFYDFLDIYDQIFSAHIRQELSKQKVDIPTYLSLYSPAVEWILHGLSQNASSHLIIELVDKCAHKKNKSLLINSILRSFKPSFITEKVEYFLQLIEASVDEGLPQYVLVKSLGESLQENQVVDPHRILNLAWKLIANYSNPSHYMACASAWCTFIVKNFTSKEVNSFLGHTIEHVGSDGKNFHLELQGILLNILNNTQDFEELFTMDKFLPTLDLFRDESLKVSICRKILEVFVSQQNNDATTDPVTTDSLMFLAKIIHDSVNALTVDDERRQIGLLIAQLIRKINFGWDFEKQLSFYVEARGTFLNIDFIHSTLVHCVNRIAMETGRVVKGHHTQKTSNFVRACAAYCYITIPSIKCECSRLQLYLLSAQVALFNQCLGQADECLKAALSVLPELTGKTLDGKVKKNDAFLLEYTCNILSTLLIIPDCPKRSVLFFTKGLVNMLQNYMSSSQNNPDSCKRGFLFVLDKLAAAAQPEYPYHVKKVESNDSLYGSDPKFLAEINKMSSVLIDELVTHLQRLESDGLFQEQSAVAFELFLRFVWHADLEKPGVLELAGNLWSLAKKRGLLQSGLARRTLASLERRVVDGTDRKGLQELVTKMKSQN